LDAVNDRGAFLNQQLADGLRPTLFLAQLPNLFAGNISLIHGVSGSSRTFMGEEAAGVDALRVALRRCAAGQGDIFLVGGAFNAARPDIHQQYHAGGILMTGAWNPLRRRSEAGVCLCSSGAFLVIEARDRAENRGAKAHARLLAVESERTVRKPGAAAQVAEGEFARILPLVKPGTLAVLSGASGRGSITAEERGFLAELAGGAKLAVRGTGAVLGHAMEAAFLQNLVLAIVAVERRTMLPPLDGAESLEAPSTDDLRQVLVTSWGHLKGEGMALVEAIDG
ncbi:MAG: beta-ketoacyl synthase N-terminal-like domain-containing protein, partial [Alphaproteobacteria bacterium]